MTKLQGLNTPINFNGHIVYKSESEKAQIQKDLATFSKEDPKRFNKILDKFEKQAPDSETLEISQGEQIFTKNEIIIRHTSSNPTQTTNEHILDPELTEHSHSLITAKCKKNIYLDNFLTFVDDIILKTKIKK